MLSQVLNPANCHIRANVLRCCALLCLLVTMPAMAQDLSLPALSSKPGPGGGQTYTLSVQTLLMLTALSFLPSVLLLATSIRLLRQPALKPASSVAPSRSCATHSGYSPPPPTRL